MACTIDKVLKDARMLVTRLKEHDNSAEALITQSQVLNNRVETMNEYQEDLNALNEIAKHRPRSNLIMSLVQESSQIRELQQQNNELQMCLGDHQSALELIMSKYRQQVVQLTISNQQQEKLANMNSPYSKELLAKENQIKEMTAIMQRAVVIDDQKAAHDQEELTQLRTENQTLRQLLQVSRWSGSTCEQTDDTTQTDESVRPPGVSTSESATTPSQNAACMASFTIPVASSCIDEYDDDKDSELSTSMTDSIDSQISMSTIRRNTEKNTSIDNTSEKDINTKEDEKDTDCESIDSSTDMKDEASDTFTENVQHAMSENDES